MRFYAASFLSEHIAETPEGYLICFDVPIGRIGEQVYAPEELPDMTPKDGRIVVDRPEGEVFTPASMASFEGKPLTIGHPEEDVTPENWQDYAHGHAQNIRRKADLLVADLLCTTSESIDAVKSKRLREISNGYDAEYRETEPGRAEQYRIEGNHIALVEAGRAGPRCSIRDSTNHDTRGKKRMSTKTRKPRSVRDWFRDRIRKTVDEATEELQEAIDAGEVAVDAEAGGAPGELVIKVEGIEEKAGGAAPASTTDEPEAVIREGKIESMLDEIMKKLDAFDGRIAALEGGAGTGDEERPIDDELAATNDPPLDPKETRTTDSAMRRVWQDVLSKAKIMAPDIRVMTFDSAAKGGRTGHNILALKRKALVEAAGTQEGVAALGGISASAVRTMDALTVDAVFSSVATAIAGANHKNPLTNDAPRRSGPPSPEEFNQRAREFWDKRAGGKNA